MSSDLPNVPFVCDLDIYCHAVSQLLATLKLKLKLTLACWLTGKRKFWDRN